MTPFFVIAAGFAVLFLTLVALVSRLLRPEPDAAGVDAIVGPKDRIAVYRASAPRIEPHPAVFLPIPEHLKTRDEMVAWMTRDLPQAVARAKR